MSASSLQGFKFRFWDEDSLSAHPMNRYPELCAGNPACW